MSKLHSRIQDGFIFLTFIDRFFRGGKVFRSRSYPRPKIFPCTDQNLHNFRVWQEMSNSTTGKIFTSPSEIHPKPSTRFCRFGIFRATIQNYRGKILRCHTLQLLYIIPLPAWIFHFVSILHRREKVVYFYFQYNIPSLAGQWIHPKDLFLQGTKTRRIRG